MSSKKIKILVTAAFFVALDIIVARFFGFEVPTFLGPIKFDFQVVVAALCGFALGPIWGGLTLVSSDILGVLLNSGTLGIFPGFTLSALLRGVLFGLLLYGKKPQPIRLVFSVILVFIPVDLTLNTLWLSIMLKAPFVPLFISRIIPKLILMVIEIVPIVFLPSLFEIVNQKNSKGKPNKKQA